MRTPIALAVSLCLALSLAACGKDKDKTPPAAGLERPPGELPRPPGAGLPDDLKPPRD